jgi:hypothetical protein
MTQRVIVDGLNFDFEDEWIVSKYDEWQFYRRFGRIKNGIKAIDLLVLSPDKTAYFVEAKDYRVHQRTKPSELSEELVAKVLATLSALLPTKINGTDRQETAIATAVLSARKLRVILHLEQPARHSKLFPRAIDPADVEQKLRQGLKPIDPHPKVTERTRMRDLPWRVT